MDTPLSSQKSPEISTYPSPTTFEFRASNRDIWGQINDGTPKYQISDSPISPVSPVTGSPREIQELPKRLREPTQQVAPVVETPGKVQESPENPALPIPEAVLGQTPETPSALDSDASNADEMEFSSEYADDIDAYSFELEQQYAVEPGFLFKHKTIRPQMRMLLVDWFVALQIHFGLQQDTLQMAVSTVDRFMSTVSYEVSCERYQLVGAACMLVACKYTETHQPTAVELTEMCDGACTLQEMLHTEHITLRVLQFRLGQPLTAYFLRRFTTSGGTDHATHTLAKYLVELALYEYSLAHFRPSVLAAAALSVAAEVRGVRPPETVTRHCGDKETSDRDFIASQLVELAALAKRNVNVQTTYKKYAMDESCPIAEVIGESWRFFSISGRKRRRIESFPPEEATNM